VTTAPDAPTSASASAGALRRDRTRLALLQAGAEVFATQGFRGASLDEVAEAAGYTKGAIYDHFGSKDDFFFAVIDHRAADRFAQFEEAIDRMTGADVEVITKQISTTLFEMLRPGRRMALLDAEAWLYAQRDSGAMVRYVEQQRTSIQRVADLVQGIAERSGVTLALPAVDLATLLVGSTIGLTQLALTDPDSRIEAVYEHLLTLGWSSSMR
jgi:AcrR family transcriptional regulator